MAWLATSTVSIFESYPIENPFNTYDKGEYGKGVSWDPASVTAGCDAQLAETSTFMLTNAPWSEVKLLPGDYTGSNVSLSFVNSAGVPAGLSFDTTVTLMVVDEDSTEIISATTLVLAGSTTCSLSIGAFTVVDETWHSTVYGATLAAQVNPTEFGDHETFARVGGGQLSLLCAVPIFVVG